MLYATALALTLFSEAGGMLLFLVLRRRYWADRRRFLALVLGINLITHPLFWFSFPLIPLAFAMKLYLAEIVVALIEGIAYRQALRLRWTEALLLGLALNLFSIIIGLVYWQR